MKKRYIRGLMVIILLGAVSESYSSWYEPYMPSRPTVQKYVPWLSGLAIGGLGYRAGRYMGYNPYLAAAIGALIGGGLGKFSASYYRKPFPTDVVVDPVLQLTEEERREEERREEERREEERQYIVEFTAEKLVNAENYDRKEELYSAFSQFGKDRDHNKQVLQEYLLDRGIIKLDDGEVSLIIDLVPAGRDRKNRLFSFVVRVIDILDLFSGKDVSNPRLSQRKYLFDELGISLPNFVEIARGLLKEYFKEVIGPHGRGIKSAKR